MVGWHHRLNGHEFEQAPGVGDRQGGMLCCSPWSHKGLDTTEWLNWTELNWSFCGWSPIFRNLSWVIKLENKSRRWLTQIPVGWVPLVWLKGMQLGEGAIQRTLKKNYHKLMLHPGAGAGAHVIYSRRAHAVLHTHPSVWSFQNGKNFKMNIKLFKHMFSVVIFK